MSADLYDDFRQAVACREDEIDLGRAALAYARCDYPGLDIAVYLARIDELAAAVRARIGGERGVYRAVAALQKVLFQEQGYRGNRADYYDPKNSFLNQVIDRKTGIPITLSVLYMEVARRIGVKFYGVGFPGHFLVKYAHDGEEIIVDPFAGGMSRSRESLGRMLSELSGGSIGFDPEFIEAVSNKQILRRMLNNLKAIYVNRKDVPRYLSVLDRLLILHPASPDELRERGFIAAQLERFRQAIADLESYLRLKPGAADAASIREQIASLNRHLA